MKRNLYKIIFYISIPGGIISFLWFLATYFAGANAFYSFPQKLIILFQVGISFLAIWYFRNLQNKHEFTFSESFLVGIVNTLIIAVLSCTLIYMYCNFVKPEIVAEQIIILQKYLIENKDLLIKQSDLATFKGNLESVKSVSASSLAIDVFIWKTIQGIMFTILCTLILRRK